jgi:DNA-binding beta-propeller fold protein YncE
MPPLPLTTLLQTALPHLNPGTRAVVSALGCFNGDTPPASKIAALVGMRSRYQLARALRREGLPSLEELAGWARVLYWMEEARSARISLRELSRRADIDTATAYRLVRRVTGRRWSELQRTGMATVTLQFQRWCRACTAGAGPRRRPRERLVATPAPLCSTWAAPRRQRARRGRPRHPMPVLAARLPVLGCPFDVAIGADDSVYVTRVHAAAVDHLLLGPLRHAGSINTGAVPTRVVLDERRHAYVTNQFTEDVGIIDVDRRRQIEAIHVPGHPMAAALSHDGRTLFVTTNLDRLCAVSLTARRVVASVPIPQVCTELALDRSGTRLYVPTWRAGVILEVEVPNLRTTRAFSVGGKVQGLTVSMDGRTLFAANEDGWLDVIRLSTGTPVKRLAFGSPAFGVAVSPDDAVLYLSLLRAGQLIVLDRVTLDVLGVLHPGGRPRRIAFDPEGRMALVANEAGWVDQVG